MNCPYRDGNDDSVHVIRPNDVLVKLNLWKPFDKNSHSLFAIVPYSFNLIIPSSIIPNPDIRFWGHIIRKYAPGCE